MERDRTRTEVVRTECDRRLRGLAAYACPWFLAVSKEGSMPMGAMAPEGSLLETAQWPGSSVS